MLIIEVLKITQNKQHILFKIKSMEMSISTQRLECKLLESRLIGLIPSLQKVCNRHDRRYFCQMICSYDGIHVFIYVAGSTLSNAAGPEILCRKPSSHLYVYNYRQPGNKSYSV